MITFTHSSEVANKAFELMEVVYWIGGVLKQGLSIDMKQSDKFSFVIRRMEVWKGSKYTSPRQCCQYSTFINPLKADDLLINIDWLLTH